FHHNYSETIRRLFVCSNADVQHEEGCFNLQNCHGLLQFDEKFSLGQAMIPVYVYDGDQYATFFYNIS
ncbi:hypothetical protein MKX03_010262, partial [Papaver bracteatum]